MNDRQRAWLVIAAMFVAAAVLLVLAAVLAVRTL